MAIILNCPGCHGRLGVLETAAGSKVKCPKCERMVPVPAPDDHLFEEEFEVVEADDFEVVDDEPKKKPKRAVEEDDEDRPRKKKAAAAWDDDEEDDEDDRPRKKFKKKQSSSNMLPLILGGAVLGVLLLGGVGYLVFSGGKSGSSGSGKGDDWVRFESPDGSIVAFFPGGTPQAEGADATAMFAAFKPPGVALDKTMAWSRKEGQREYVVGFAEFKALPASINAEAIYGIMKKTLQTAVGSSSLDEKHITISGEPAIVLGYKEGGIYEILVFCLKGNRMFVSGGSVHSTGGTIDDELCNKFITRLELKAVASTPNDGRRPNSGRTKR